VTTLLAFPANEDERVYREVSNPVTVIISAPSNLKIDLEVPKASAKLEIFYEGLGGIKVNKFFDFVYRVSKLIIYDFL